MTKGELDMKCYQIPLEIDPRKNEGKGKKVYEISSPELLEAISKTI
jgi:hypothetical protein